MFRKTLKAAVGAFNKVCNLLLGIVMVAMFLVLLLQIISRFIAFVPLPWSHAGSHRIPANLQCVPGGLHCYGQ